MCKGVTFRSFYSCVKCKLLSLSLPLSAKNEFISFCIYVIFMVQVSQSKHYEIQLDLCFPLCQYSYFAWVRRRRLWRLERNVLWFAYSFWDTQDVKCRYKEGEVAWSIRSFLKLNIKTILYYHYTYNIWRRYNWMRTLTTSILIRRLFEVFIETCLEYFAYYYYIVHVYVTFRNIYL